MTDPARPAVAGDPHGLFYAGISVGGDWDIPTVGGRASAAGRAPRHATPADALDYLRPLAIGAPDGCSHRIAALRFLGVADRRDDLTWPHDLRLAPRRLGPAYDPPRPDALDEAADACGVAVLLTKDCRAHHRRLFEIVAEETVVPQSRPKRTI